MDSKILLCAMLCMSLTACLNSETKTVSADGVTTAQYDSVVAQNQTLVSNLVPRVQALESGTYQRLQSNGPFRLMDAGNPLGENAMDLQNFRSGPSQVAAGNYSIAVGQENTAAQNFTTAIGTQNTVDGEGSVAIGFGNAIITSGSNMVIGMGNTAISWGGTTIGIGVTSDVAASVTFGSFSKRKIVVQRSDSIGEMVVFESGIPKNMICEVKALWADGSVVHRRVAVVNFGVRGITDVATSTGKAIAISVSGNTLYTPTTPTALGLWFDCEEF